MFAHSSELFKCYVIRVQVERHVKQICLRCFTAQVMTPPSISGGLQMTSLGVLVRPIQRLGDINYQIRVDSERCRTSRCRRPCVVGPFCTSSRVENREPVPGERLQQIANDIFRVFDEDKCDAMPF